MKKNKKSFEEGKKMPALESNREARIQAIKEAIAAGTYRIDNGELADSLVRRYSLGTMENNTIA